MQIGLQTVFVIIIVIIICYFSLDIKNDDNTKNKRRVRFDPNDQIIENNYIEYDNTNELLQKEAETNGYINLMNYPGLLNKKIKIDKRFDPYERETQMYIYKSGSLGIYYPDVDHYHMTYKAITGNPVDSFYSSISNNSF